jgi:uncharacterized protein (TIGR00251 family)
VREGAVRIRVAAPPTDGKANAALRTFLARALGLRARDVTIVSGERSREKVLRLSGMAPEEVAARLQTP